MKLVEVNKVEEWEVEKILDKIKNQGSGKVSGVMERIYSRAWFMEKRGELGKCKECGNRVWEEAEYRSEKMRKVGYDGEKRL